MPSLMFVRSSSQNGTSSLRVSFASRSFHAFQSIPSSDSESSSRSESFFVSCVRRFSPSFERFPERLDALVSARQWPFPWRGRLSLSLPLAFEVPKDRVARSNSPSLVERVLFCYLVVVDSSSRASEAFRFSPPLSCEFSFRRFSRGCAPCSDEYARSVRHFCGGLSSRSSISASSAFRLVPIDADRAIISIAILRLNCFSSQ